MTAPETLTRPVESSWPAVSVVIPTYKRDDLLGRCLEGVLTQDYPAQSLQVVVVDDADSETTPVAVGEVAARHPHHQVIVLGGSHLGPAHARNVGWRAATGDIIAFIDDDAFPANEQWLRRGVSHLMAGQGPAVSGRVVVPVPPAPTDFQRNVHRLEGADFLTCNAFVYRDALEAVEGFDERFAVPFREDSDLQFRLESFGGPIEKVDGAVVVHPAPRGKFLESMRRERYSMYNALLYKKHRNRYRNEIQSRPPLNYYAMAALLLVGLGALLKRKPLLAGLAMAGWGFLDGMFFARRIDGTERSPRHIADMAVTSAVIPLASIYWRLRGAARFRVWFV